ncbi:unnamed protein product [Adineta ricciae]|uniref:RING-type domain-containing protein n=1 Tax=Adineta ricciae TaxID=249248 RepID=A0A814VKM9_ADIRI|nr:unnamed protein product [Adineta ricciae]CAF1190292.1 unnamed protein product [Adineta ricciae]
MPAIRHHYNRGPRNGPGDHAPHINFTHIGGHIHVELKKAIQSGEERTLLLTPERFFEISHKSDEIRQAGRHMAEYQGRKSATQPPKNIGSFEFVLRSDSRNDVHEHMYQWEIPNSELRVNVRNRRSDGKRPIDTQFVVEIRIFNDHGFPTDSGIMMAWHNFHGTFVRHRKERRDRIEEMRRNGTSNISTTTSSNGSRPTTTASNVADNKNLSSWIIDEKYVNQETYSCVICMDTYVKNDHVQGLSKCTHYFHQKCIQAWLIGSATCPVCRSEA